MASKAKTEIAYLKIRIVDLLGHNIPKINTTIKLIDDYYYLTPKPIKQITDKDGIVKFRNIAKGYYIIKVSKGKSYSSKIYEIRESRFIIFRLRFLYFFLNLFGWIFGAKAREYEINKIYERIRTDITNCFFCKQHYNHLPYLCRYCKKYYCSKCRVPETHKCLDKGPRNKLPYGFREIHTRGGMTVIPD